MSKEHMRAVVAMLCLFGYALAARFLALTQPYHQDEYKWALAADPHGGVSPDTIPHPFLGKFVYHLAGEAFGYDHLRLVPIILSVVFLALLFFYVKKLFSREAAFAAVTVYIFSFYALLSSVQIDIDGVFLPLTALAAFFAYELVLREPYNKKYLAALALSLVVGFCIKLSFILVPAALAVDYLFRNPGIVRFFLRRNIILAGVALLVLGGLALAVVWDQVLFLRNVRNYLALSGRNFGELAFLTGKALIYMSPLIPAGIILGLRLFHRLRLWFIFLAINIVFYFVLFDFSHRTFDRYLMFILLPGAIIAGVAFADYGIRMQKERRHLIFFAAALAFFAVLAHVLFSRPHTIVPLIPKSGFIHAITAFDWGFLLPLTGGSGPLGFYVPWDGMALLWGLAALLFAIVLFVRKPTTYAFAAFLALSLVYNVFVTSEYLFGTYYGSAPKVLSELTEAIDRDARVITYNDTGAYTLFTQGAYAGRFYPHPEFIPNNAPRLSAHAGLFLVVGLPILNPDSIYSKYFGTCRAIEKAESGLVRGLLLDCSRADTKLLDPAAPL